jgi:archaellum biogenesis protein FlaJ (TadC family)
MPTPKGVLTTPEAATASPLSGSDVTMSYEDDELVGRPSAMAHEEENRDYKPFLASYTSFFDNSLKDLGIIAACYTSIYAFVTLYYLWLLKMVIDEGEDNFNILYFFFLLFLLAVTMVVVSIAFSKRAKFEDESEQKTA